MKFMDLLVLGLLALFSLQCNSDAAEEPTLSGPFYLGADLSYVNEMEDCGVVYKENGQAKDPYQLFSDKGCQLVRLRLWHTPAWYDTLNQGKRYSDFADVRKSVQRAKAAGMPVLLDFHLSDFWADPGRQLVPAAWLPVVHDLPVLQDSLYNYVFQTLTRLNADGLLPEMVQIGNETNRMILLSPQDNATGVPINWARNAALFNSGIAAVRAVEKIAGKKIQVMIHLANPAEARLLMPGFWANGVRDFDLIGLSYYWAWHKPMTIAQAGAVVAELQNSYPGKSVMIAETAYIWTNDANDNANNIISEVHPDYAPASPEHQRKWLVDLSNEVKQRGGAGVIYWEPAWVSSPCRTPWGQGSHQEHAAFFDFDTNVLTNGGMDWFGTAF
ncbi:MAG: glycosyl hydrolase 53 family protein [Saprospiraceae bacterium]